MTAKRNDEGFLEEVRQGLGTKSFRIALMAAFLSQTPLADGVWKTIGMKSLSTQINELADKAKTIEDDVKQIHEHVEALDKKITEDNKAAIKFREQLTK